MRFDDALDTVLATEMSTPSGIQAVWRQLVDLIGRSRAPANVAAIARLRAIRADVPPPVRAASARALEFANPPAVLVRLFADDDLTIAAPVLRSARLRADEWIDMLPSMPPLSRSLLRNRRDLSPDVLRALESFGTVDFVLPRMPAVAAEEAAVPEPAIEPVAELAPETQEPVAPEPVIQEMTMLASAPEAEPEAEEVVAGHLEPTPVEPAPVARKGWFAWPTAAPVPVADEPEPLLKVAEEPIPGIPLPQLQDEPFVSVAEVAMALPVVAEAMRIADEPDPETAAEISPVALVESAPETPGSFEISDLVARIDAFQRAREEQPALPFAEADLHATPIDNFRFETDAQGVVCWVAGVSREPLIGLSLDLAAVTAGVRADGVAGGAFRRRAPFTDARLTVEGHSDAAGDWRISGVPVFASESGRFTGYRGTARRPRIDEQAEPLRHRSPVADSLRQLVHELRTPTNAIAGFAEMIEGQMLGPVPETYRDQAATIREQARDLIVAIDDIDIAARIDAGALDIRNATVVLTPILSRLAQELRPLADLRQAAMLVVAASDLAVEGDDRAIDRLLSRLLATILSAAAPGEQISVRGGKDGRDTVAILINRPRGLPVDLEDADAESEAAAPGGPLLGTGFALRLAQNLARELGGSLDLGAERLTLRLPAAVDQAVEQATTL
ncbi:hypothetical protein BH09PSE4_BH09PSE4_18850 [soil metagenome]